MAYSGLPSKACANCRIRRIKCNLLEPACSQCRRAGKVCPGYRDELSLIFRDENAKVIRKAHGRIHAADRPKTRQVIKTLPPFPLRTPTTSISESETQSATSPSPTKNSQTFDLSLWALSTPLEDQGVNFFFTHYLTSRLPAQDGPLNVSTWPLWQQVSVHRPFMDAVSSVGLAGLANVKKSREMMTIARLKYASTLHQVMNALRNPAQADLDYTLKAVMMLALFEIVNCTPESAGSWGVHLGGAIALLNSEHFRKFQETAEVRMKLQFCFSIFINCIHKGERLPLVIAVWCRIWGASLCQSDSPAASLAGLIIRYIDLCASVKARDFSNPNTIVQKALQLDNDLEYWRINLPPFWNYTVEIARDDSDGAFNGQYHIYNDPWIDRMWDHYRWVRILVHELILSDSGSSLSHPNQSTQQPKSLVLISQLASDICASVASALYRLAPQPGIHNSAPRVGGIFMVLWTLKIAGSAIGVSDALHEWVVGVLEDIGRTMGILQTRIVISTMKRQREQWKQRMFYVLNNNRQDYEDDIDTLSSLVDVD